MDRSPDYLLIKILSFVPTKDAVSMTILSKRWLSLWKLAPRLIFSENHDTSSLSQFVSATLLLHKAAVLESFPRGTVLFQLVRLELCSCDDSWTNMLVSVLQHSPKLQALKLVLVRWIQPMRVPECLLLHLKAFEWRDYEGTKVEKEVAIYNLDNAKRLVTVTIYPVAYPVSVSFVRKHRMFEEVEVATRSSRACELTMG